MISRQEWREYSWGDGKDNVRQAVANALGVALGPSRVVSGIVKHWDTKSAPITAWEVQWDPASSGMQHSRKVFRAYRTNGSELWGQYCYPIFSVGNSVWMRFLKNYICISYLNITLTAIRIKHYFMIYPSKQIWLFSLSYSLSWFWILLEEIEKLL
jgi:hypothetical protein